MISAGCFKMLRWNPSAITTDVSTMMWRVDWLQCCWLLDVLMSRDHQMHLTKNSESVRVIRYLIFVSSRKGSVCKSVIRDSLRCAAMSTRCCTVWSNCYVADSSTSSRVTRFSSSVDTMMRVQTRYVSHLFGNRMISSGSSYFLFLSFSYLLSCMI